MVLACLMALAFLQHPYHHEEPEFQLELPTERWEAKNTGGGNVLAMVFTPVADMSTRCSVLRFPVSFLPEGLKTRESQIVQAAGTAYQLVEFRDETIDERDAVRWEYTVAGATSVEWAFEEEDAWVIFQLAAPAAVWADQEQRQDLEAIRDSFVWVGGEISLAMVDRTPAEEIRAQRAATAAASSDRAFEVTQHVIEATLEPTTHSLELDDTLTILSRRDDLREIRLYTSTVKVDEVTADVSVSWRMESLPQADVLIINLDDPLAAGESLTFDVHLFCEDFLQTVDQHLVQEISVVGQIRPRSSFSSHVLWYPIDDGNDAAVDITFDVPRPYTALTGGTLISQEDDGDRRRFHYREDLRIPRQIPFGFAVADYRSGKATSEAGLELSVWGFPEEGKRIVQRQQVLLECAAAFERALGPLPWSPVRFVHVAPVEKETGISLPGMIVVSDQYFPDLEGLDASSGNLNDPAVLGLLVVADELSHQWNFYASAFPNELAEGISTYTNALFLEEREGFETYARTVGFCRDAWIGGAGQEMEFAIANPMVYSNTRYRSVVFCKTPVVLDALRRRLGDETFFAGFRRAFDLPARDVDGFERMQQGFSEIAKTDLRWFFDQWFFTAGFPTVEYEHTFSGGSLELVVRQTQEESTYRLATTVEVLCTDGSSHEFAVEITDREHNFSWELPTPPETVTLGPEHRLPARLVRR